MLKKPALELDLRNDRFRKKIFRFFSFLITQKKIRFNRVLPLSEYWNDRLLKAKQLGFGEGSSCYDHVYIFGDVKVGEKTFIGPFCVLDGTGGLQIGRYCSISAGVHIYTHDSVKWAITQGREPYEYAPVVIGDGCYIGPHSVIAKGVHIGEGSVIGAGSFVNKDVTPYTKVAGIPARIIGDNMKYQHSKNGSGGGAGLIDCQSLEKEEVAA